MQGRSQVDGVPRVRQPRVGADVDSDHCRGKITLPVIDDLANLSEGRTPLKSSSVEWKDAARTLIIDGNQVLDALQTVEYVMVLAEIKPWFTEEPDECVPPFCPLLPFAPFNFFHSRSSRK